MKPAFIFQGLYEEIEAMSFLNDFDEACMFRKMYNKHNALMCELLSDIVLTSKPAISNYLFGRRLS